MDNSIFNFPLHVEFEINNFVRQVEACEDIDKIREIAIELLRVNKHNELYIKQTMMERLIGFEDNTSFIVP